MVIGANWIANNEATFASAVVAGKRLLLAHERNTEVAVRDLINQLRIRYL
jgi:hypothetical protein